MQQHAEIANCRCFALTIKLCNL